MPPFILCTLSFFIHFYFYLLSILFLSLSAFSFPSSCPSLFSCLFNSRYFHLNFSFFFIYSVA
jgi:hypothetical protein